MRESKWMGPGGCKETVVGPRFGGVRPSVALRRVGAASVAQKDQKGGGRTCSVWGARST